MSDVVDRLRQKGVPFGLIHHGVCASATEEARVLSVKPETVAKSVVLTTSAGHAIAVVPASRRVDLDAARDATADPTTRLATEAELRRDFPEYELGAMPILGNEAQTETYVDPSVMAHDLIVFADTRTASVIADPRAMFADEGVVVIDLTLPAGRVIDLTGPRRVKEPSSAPE